MLFCTLLIVERQWVFHSYMVFKKIDDLDVIQKEIESITAEDIIRVANEIYSEEKLSSLKYI